MPKLVDHDERRRDLTRAVWRVILRDGVDGASVRTVAREAGTTPSALRHYFVSQSELLGFAMEVVVDRIEQRLAARERADDPRREVEQVLCELLPLDAERQAENQVWLAFTGRALSDPDLRIRQHRVDDALRSGCLRAVETLVAAGRASAVLDAELEAEHLHALLDGLALHAATRPGRMSPPLMVAVVTNHLDTLDSGRRRP